MPLMEDRRISHLPATPLKDFLPWDESVSTCQRGEESMGLYERILEQRAEEERRRGRPLGPYRGIDSPVFDRLVARASSKDAYSPG
jgi:hypothetical protein